MGSEEFRRRIVFGLALAALAAGAFAMAIFDREQGSNASAEPAPRLGQPRDVPDGQAKVSRPGVNIRAAARSARRFLEAYLRYQEGRLDRSDREALLLNSTPDLGPQLVRAPVRVPPGRRAPRQFVARVAAVQAGLFDGGPAFHVSLVVAGKAGTHLLGVSLIEREGSWLVAGIGP